jgi:hypothetical protein
MQRMYKQSRAVANIVFTASLQSSLILVVFVFRIQVGPLKSDTLGTRLVPDQRIFCTIGGQYITLPKHVNKPL